MTYCYMKMPGYYRAAEKEGEAVSEWQPIETAPRDGRIFLAWEEREITYRLAFFSRGEWRYLPFDLECYPTHWMPLPPPPEVKP